MLPGSAVVLVRQHRVGGFGFQSQLNLRIIDDDFAAIADAQLGTDLQGNLLLWTVSSGNGTQVGQLGRQYIRLFQFRRLGQQLGGLRHQGRGKFSVQVRIAPGVVWKGVKDGEGSGIELNGKPCDRCRLPVDYLQATGEKSGQFPFFSRLGFHGNE